MFPGGIASYSLFLLTALRSPLALEVPGFQRHNIAEACAGHVFNDPIPAGTPAAACMNAIISGDESGALTQLGLGADVNACDEVGLTLMHHAAQAGMLRLINDLKRRGADINARSIVNESVLTYVILSNARDESPRNHLHEVIDFMVRNRADLDSGDSYQMTPVMHAARLGDAVALDKLRQGRANLFLEDSNGYNALCYATLGCRQLTVSYLLQVGVDPRLVVQARGLIPSALAQEALARNKYSGEFLVDLRQCLAKLCLGEAIADAYEILGESPVGRDLTQAFDDVTAFRKAHLLATTQGNMDRSMACLQVLGEIMGFKSPTENSPEYQLLASCYYNNIPALQQVLEQNVPPNPQNHFGRTALALAVLGRHHEAAQVLLDWRANTEIPDVVGSTPLMFAAINGDTQMVDMLLAKHANPLARDWQGFTAYDYAMMSLHDDQASRDWKAPETTAQCFIPHPVASRLLIAMQEWQRAETRIAIAEKRRYQKNGLQLS